ncbi:hypothetical protein [Mangrovibacter yixingensis]|uniref:hypothetical protein n=1 Tax=Mangrovibacter yixingensis TaxID=1529639 RepID=UPI001CFB728B|nr:hypothetical protein [Mangrovibacter yixingensis]
MDKFIEFMVLIAAHNSARWRKFSGLEQKWGLQAKKTVVVQHDYGQYSPGKSPGFNN